MRQRGYIRVEDDQPACLLGYEPSLFRFFRFLEWIADLIDESLFKLV